MGFNSAFKGLITATRDACSQFLYLSHLLTFAAHHVPSFLIFGLLTTCCRYVHYPSSPAIVTLCVLNRIP